MDRVELELAICWKILEIRKEFPQLRIGQIISDACYPAGDSYYVSDIDLFQSLITLLADYRKAKG